MVVCVTHHGVGVPCRQPRLYVWVMMIVAHTHPLFPTSLNTRQVIKSITCLKTKHTMTSVLYLWCCMTRLAGIDNRYHWDYALWLALCRSGFGVVCFLRCVWRGLYAKLSVQSMRYVCKKCYLASEVVPPFFFSKALTQQWNYSLLCFWSYNLSISLALKFILDDFWMLSHLMVQHCWWCTKC